MLKIKIGLAKGPIEHKYAYYRSKTLYLTDYFKLTLDGSCKYKRSAAFANSSQDVIYVIMDYDSGKTLKILQVMNQYVLSLVFRNESNFRTQAWRPFFFCRPSEKGMQGLRNDILIFRLLL